MLPLLLEVSTKTNEGAVVVVLFLSDPMGMDLFKLTWVFNMIIDHHLQGCHCLGGRQGAER